MPEIHSPSAPRSYRQQDTPTTGAAWRKGSNKALTAGAAAAVVLLLTGCGGTQASLTAAPRPASGSATATPSPTPLAHTPCTTLNGEQTAAGSTYICTQDESGRLVWLEAAESKRIAGKLAAAAAAEAAAAAKAAAPPAYVAPAVPGTNPGCDPNYSGCVPIASDVDCAGGSGNGPAYVSGPVQVIGRDIYGLDADHDGVGCER